MVMLKLQLKIPFNRREDALHLLNSCLGPAGAQPGLINAEVYTTLNDEDLVLLEEWSSREELVKHLQSDDFRHVLAVMDIAVEQPEIYFHTVVSSQGFELLENLRGTG